MVLKAAKPRLLERLEQFQKQLDKHKDNVSAKLQQHLDQSVEQIIDYYLPIVMANMPDALVGQLLSGQPTDDDGRRWLRRELNRVLPRAESLIQEMKLDARFKDVTFETLNQADFFESVKSAFPAIDWNKPYKDFKAAGERSRP